MAQYNLGNFYVKGQVIGQDYTQAFYWYKKSAEQGNSKAQYNLGMCYRNGEGVEPDYSMAIYWLRKAADNGNEDARNALNYL